MRTDVRVGDNIEVPAYNMPQEPIKPNASPTNIVWAPIRFRRLMIVEGVHDYSVTAKEIKTGILEEVPIKHIL